MGGGDGTPPPPVQTVIVGGMPGWQIALIAAAALLAPAIAALWDRVHAARHNPVTGAASALHVPSSPWVTSRSAAPGQPRPGRRCRPGRNTYPKGAVDGQRADVPRQPGAPGPRQRPAVRTARQGAVPVRGGRRRLPAGDGDRPGPMPALLPAAGAARQPQELER